MDILKILAISLMIQIICICVTSADELRLKNGDRVSGRVVAMEKNQLVFKTTYAGEITVDWHEVSHLTTDSPITVMVGDRISLQGTAEPAREGQIRMKQDKIAESATFDLSDVTEINPKPEPPVKIKARANVGLSYSDGNTNNESIYLDGRFVARMDADRIIIGGEYNRERTDGQTTADRAAGNLEYNHFFTKKWYGYSKIGLEKDDFKDLNLRTDVGVGPGYQVFESERLNLAIAAGVSYVNQDFIVQEDDNYTAYRLATDYDQFFFEKFLQVFHSNEAFVRTDDTKDIFIRTRTGVRIPFYKNLNLTGQYNLEWDNKPAPDTKKTDQKVIFSLGYSYE